MKMRNDILYSEVDSFFELNGNNLMKLTPDAAVELCKVCLDKEIIVVCVEGGIWNDKKFQARLDAIWTGKKPPLNLGDLMLNNERAIASIAEDRDECNAFIVSTLPNV